MNGKELEELLQGHEDEPIRLSISGETPISVRAVAYIEGNVVLMAVPGWAFSELSEAMTALEAAMASAPKQDLNDGWLRFWNKVDGAWVCKAHGQNSGQPNCQVCRDATPQGWHKGIANDKWFCNKHSQGACPKCGLPEGKDG